MGKKTPLFERHRELGAKIVDFAGWEMPLQYQGILQEHQTVRNNAGLFDVSHMGRIAIEGKGVGAYLNFLSTQEILGKPDGSVMYTVWCNDQGRAIDDLLVYKISDTSYFVVANASNREKDFAHMCAYAADWNVKITPVYEQEGILALQGPHSAQILSQLFPQIDTLKPMHLLTTTFHGYPLIISRSGYTGELGFELFVDHAVLVDLWNVLMEAGALPVGLGARDTLRLEMGYALFGHELNETIYPTETVANWVVKLNHEFLGRTAIEKLTHPRYQCGALLQEPGIAREGCVVFFEGKPCGVVTSGTFSPTLRQAIAIVFVEEKLKPHDMVTIQIREKQVHAEIVKLPFLQSRGKPKEES